MLLQAMAMLIRTKSWASFEIKKHCMSFSYAATCMDEDSAGGGDVAEQLSLKKKEKKHRSLQWSIAFALSEHVGVVD